jgi:hypothetical protein
MSTSLLLVKEQLYKNVKLYRQRTPIVHAYSEQDYKDFAIEGSEKLYVDAGWSTWETDYNNNSATPTITRNLTLTQLKYAIVSAEIKFWEQAYADWMTLIGVTTNAVSTTYPQKPTEFIEKRIQRLEQALTELFYKLGSDVTSMTEITSITIQELDVNYE